MLETFRKLGVTLDEVQLGFEFVKLLQLRNYNWKLRSELQH